MEDLPQRSMGMPRSRILAIVGADQSTISDSHVYALEREFPGLEVRRARSFEELVEGAMPAVALILVEPPHVEALQAALGGIARRFPRAAVTLLQDDESAGVTLETIRALPRDVGVLPMDLRLDVWLAAVRIMLLGGCYYPPALVRAGASEAARGSGAAARPSEGDAAPTARFRGGALTAREEQILGMVARGLQNKIIAATLGLSEHTVKLHLHKIISKLGVHNRTEAAISYLGWRAPTPAAAPDGLARHHAEGGPPA